MTAAPGGAALSPRAGTFRHALSHVARLSDRYRSANPLAEGSSPSALGNFSRSPSSEWCAVVTFSSVHHPAGGCRLGRDGRKRLAPREAPDATRGNQGVGSPSGRPR
jgi:hypothetical protein